MVTLKHRGPLTVAWELRLALVTMDHGLGCGYTERPCQPTQNTPCILLPVGGLLFAPHTLPGSLLILSDPQPESVAQAL